MPPDRLNVSSNITRPKDVTRVILKPTQLVRAMNVSVSTGDNNFKQECIPVGCVPSAGAVCLRGVSA